MSYEMCMEKAGAIIHVFQCFGSYQGDWLAKVTYNGKTGWVRGCYGSCSGCDAFEAEFGWADGYCDKHAYDSRSAKTCPDCIKAQEDLDRRYADFGRTYLDGIYSSEYQIECLEKEIDCGWGDWDDSREMLEFVKANK